ncbi:SDR family oxidoreductase [Paenibacillus albiflavus]|uniref:SDR family oxidoreductase n=1 Tax=Paenibacillus albiflavus TaxID=2545760 RepID=A0A4R4E7R7_9BACL|nr:SDR family oxidoreductase [Paenibacillus albiflavus]TCZ75794.1 SDR family oxidoreductase [Paenibacillus albiflavus]
MDLRNKIVVITGGTSGIGAEMARQFVKEGAIPVITGRSLERLQVMAEEFGDSIGIYAFDVRDEASTQQALEQIEQKYETIDILINNAGFGVFETFVDTPVDRFMDMMDVNYMGIVRCTKQVLPGMLKRGQGHIVNIASIAGKMGTAKSTGYSASKHAVLGLTNSLRQELTGTGVKVTAINPGPIDTPFFHTADPTGNYVKNVKSFMLKPDKVAQVVIKAIKRGSAERNIPNLFAVGVIMSQLFPRTFERFAARFLNKK